MTSATAALGGPLRKRESSLWAREANDWYVEPEWCSARLFEEEPFVGTILDPACGGGNIVRSAFNFGHSVVGSDIVDRGFSGCRVVSFFDRMRGDDMLVRNIVSNPPFGIAEKFVQHALWLVDGKVAMLLPANWVQGDKRSRWLQSTPLYRVWFITPRPSMPPGQAIAAGQKPGNGTTDYAWFVWLKGFDGTPTIRWLRRGDVKPKTSFEDRPFGAPL